MAYTLGQMRSLVRQRADMEGSNFISDAELDLYIWDSIFECYEVLTALSGNEAVVRSADVQCTPAGAGAVPTYNNRGPYKIVRVDVPFEGVRRPIPRLNIYSAPLPTDTVTWSAATPLEYIVASGNVSIYPLPATTTTCRVYFVPYPAQPTTATDTISDISPWEEYVAIDAAIKCKEKEESDTTALERAKQNILLRMERWSAVFDRNPMSIADARLDGEDAPVTWWY